jgi:hypothetical protein
LAEEAIECAPRLFALYGVYRRKMFEGDEDGFLGWGMELAEPRKALLWTPDGSIWRSESAANLLKSHQRGAMARLLWLDEPS